MYKWYNYIQFIIPLVVIDDSIVIGTCQKCHHIILMMKLN